MPEPTVVPKAFRKRTISLTYRRAAGDPLYGELLALLLSLRNAQRKVDRRLPRILPVVASLQEQAGREGGASHVVTRQWPGLRTIARLADHRRSLGLCSRALPQRLQVRGSTTPH